MSLAVSQVIVCSATTGQRTDKIFDAIERAAKQFYKRVPTAIIK